MPCSLILQIVCPELDIIDPHTFEYRAGPVGMNGGFDWLLQFTWKPVTDYHSDTDRSQPIRYVYKLKCTRLRLVPLQLIFIVLGV